MSLSDIKKCYRHLPPRHTTGPKPRLYGIVSRILAALGQRSIDGQWQPKSPKSNNWKSERGSFDPNLPYSPGKPQKKTKATATPLVNKTSGELDPVLTSALLSTFPRHAAEMTRAQVPAFEVAPEAVTQVLSWLRNSAPVVFDLPLHMTALDWPTQENDNTKDDRAHIPPKRPSIELVYELRSSQSSSNVECQRNIECQSATSQSQRSADLTTSPACSSRVSIHCRIDRDNPVVASSSSVYPCFAWHEREVAELFGVEFLGHPDPRKLLLDSSYTGYPMRKDYEDPDHEFIKRPY